MIHIESNGNIPFVTEPIGMPGMRGTTTAGVWPHKGAP
jgi:hypothetical protein